jgi:hypothetical protein
MGLHHAKPQRWTLEKDAKQWVLLGCGDGLER